MASPDPELQALQEKWSPAWTIWRTRRADDPPGVFTGELVATRMHEAAGAERTIMRRTGHELDAVLRLQKDLAEQGVRW